ncbi:hypothetical protein A6770_03555 [Nostoc minutum NIES-26]|uniref:Uncharacterized protein n=1 Tax=Nostoc minutum NIES-26 TaxID=1844469 RepID=A0A367QKM7_9NOSO|nr:hypothetical protein A6770_03555 [Nostoc minutum NIES-26]
MNNNRTNYLASTQQTGLPIEVILPQPTINNPQTELRDGNSAADIITAVAVLIGTITGLVKALLLLWLKKQRQKSK